MAMDKLHDSRKQFEEFYCEEYLRGSEALTRSTVTGSYIYAHAQGHWKSWIRSRASIVVDTPQLCGDGENDSEYTDGYNDGVTATEKTIRSIGLSIKGE